MAWTQADVDVLKAAIASGVKQVVFNGRSTTYADFEQMRAALAMMEAEVAATTGTSSPRIFYGYAGKGL